MPNNTNWPIFMVVLTGIFTMSLFVGNLAFVENMQTWMASKLGF